MLIKLDPVGKPRMTQRDRWKFRPAVVKYHEYCDKLRDALPGYELGMDLNIRFYIAMPKSYSKKKRAELDGTYHDQKPDIDNLAKGFMDAFKSEDKHVAVLHAEKYWAEEGAVEVL